MTFWAAVSIFVTDMLVYFGQTAP